LIDDGVAINKAWDVENNDFKEYESDWFDYPPRRHFTEESTGPFTIVSEKNTCYKKYIEMDIEKRFKREDQDYIGYTAPALHVIGCRLSPGLKIPICGRYPDL
jgi:hypothetical protein